MAPRSRMWILVWTLIVIGTGGWPIGTTRAQTPPPTPTLAVTGTGEIGARPDMAEVQVGVVTEADTARKALDANNTAMRALLKTIAAHEIAERDVQTVAFRVSPLYARQNRTEQPPRIIGYRIENRLGLKVRELSRVGQVLDALVTQGANLIHSVQFRVGDPQPLLDIARRAAVEDAQRKAELYAEAAGVALGRVLSIREERVNLPRPQPLMARAMAAEAVPLQQGELTFTVHVDLTYELTAP